VNNFEANNRLYFVNTVRDDISALGANAMRNVVVGPIHENGQTRVQRTPVNVLETHIQLETLRTPSSSE
jgi:hypothetical protein